MNFRLSSLALLICDLAISSCNTETIRKDIVFDGYAQGTTFHIVYDTTAGNLDSSIMEIFKKVDTSVSLYDSLSCLVQFNKASDSYSVDTIFINLLKMSKSVYNATGGAFNPAVYPLVTYWGFSPEKFRNQHQSSATSVDSAKALVRFDLLEIPDIIPDSSGKMILKKPFPAFQLDFNAIAQGYTVDLIANMFNSKNVRNFMIEVGGEVRTKGTGSKNTPWRLGIDKPIENSDKRELQAIVNMNDLSLATSGNYRKFYVKDGKKYAHTIDPSTGKPVQHSLLSASVFTESCAMADAYATAFMVMGTKKSIAFVNKNPTIQIYLIYTASNGDFQTHMSEGLKGKLEETFD